MPIACFQLLSNGKIKQLTKEQYSKRLGRKNYTVGYTDGDWILFSRNWEVITLTKEKLDTLLNLPKNAELP